jgi:glycosyltransferase involved in cell wall biosynthesis
MAPVGIIIITYNSAAEVGACLDAVLRIEADVVVVDNASSDGTGD